MVSHGHVTSHDAPSRQRSDGLPASDSQVVGVDVVGLLGRICQVCFYD